MAKAKTYAQEAGGKGKGSREVAASILVGKAFREGRNAIASDVCSEQNKNERDGKLTSDFIDHIQTPQRRPPQANRQSQFRARAEWVGGQHHCVHMWQIVVPAAQQCEV